ncbi:conserved hypothetical protein [Bathymodiolus platifrons methanotrophic gill symbiont]|uniref:hypothetical protein n=1 Tax=Bathymodiolus platifrons methanotrophic gill symbiont TaxID=113268 RepID=UPI000B647C95|nr:hypothetical protein [Bathymodiolus platifrons methanotrophic gill symbiont]GAW86550.1 conserved hypothetical protein [Bathymodiolus platifrons methanotrophic gill symbiont]GFO77689.1 hypothetical protein BPLS_P6283 [Bathymodiolus platifrons methanotrophic gill symbiont]
MKQEFDNLMAKLTAERDEAQLKLHLASMEVKEEFEGAEKTWGQIKQKAGEIADDSVETTDEFISAAKVVGEELTEAYQRITKRINS